MLKKLIDLGKHEFRYSNNREIDVKILAMIILSMILPIVMIWK